MCVGAPPVYTFVAFIESLGAKIMFHFVLFIFFVCVRVQTIVCIIITEKRRCIQNTKERIGMVIAFTKKK